MRSSINIIDSLFGLLVAEGEEGEEEETADVKYSFGSFILQKSTLRDYKYKHKIKNKVRVEVHVLVPRTEYQPSTSRVEVGVESRIQKARI